MKIRIFVDEKQIIKFSWPNIHHSKNRSRDCDTGWVLCPILLTFIWIHFKLQKGTPTIVTPST